MSRAKTAIFLMCLINLSVSSSKVETAFFIAALAGGGGTDQFFEILAWILRIMLSKSWKCLKVTSSN
jgi:hypothetical protein